MPKQRNLITAHEQLQKQYQDNKTFDYKTWMDLGFMAEECDMLKLANKVWKEAATIQARKVLDGE